VGVRILIDRIVIAGLLEAPPLTDFASELRRDLTEAFADTPRAAPRAVGEIRAELPSDAVSAATIAATVRSAVRGLE
jgi:hypothetical protein